MTNTDYTDDLVFFCKYTCPKPNLYCIAWRKAAGGIDLHKNVNKTDFMRF